jgi:uncharacterized protein (TIGR02996 family)
MSMKEAFLRAIVERPDDDTPRHVYADWLEENGEPERADFIRLQIRAWALTHDAWGPSPLSARIQKLYWDNRERWAREELPAWLHKEHYIEFRRGFVEGVGTTALRAVERAEEMWRTAPLRALVLRGAGGRVKAVATCPFLARVTELTLLNRITDEDVIALAGSPFLGRLRELDLSNSQAGDDAARALAACPGLASLARLDLHICRVGDAGALALASSPYLGKLERLDLLCNPISHSARAALKERLGPKVSV